MKTHRILTVLSFMIVIILISCNSNKDLTNNVDILGTWISTDKSDTLDFVDKTNFYKSSIDYRYDLFDYTLDSDSLTVGYNGIREILVQPSKHKYNLEGNTLTIDFSNESCYGFDLKVMTYSKE